MSFTLTITGNNPILQSDFYPPLILNNNDYECGILYFSTFNSIPNINDKNNIFVYGAQKEIKVPCGTYDFQDLSEYLKNKVEKCDLQIKPNINTLSCSLFCTETIDFQVKNTIAPLFGFSSVKLEPNKWHESNKSVNILPVSVIRIECDLIQGSYTNGAPTHIIHEFVLNVPPGHQIIEVPKNIVYFPINKKVISTIKVRILDLCGNIVDFRNENIQLCLHLRKIK